MDPYAATSYLIASATSLPVYHFTLLIHDSGFGCLPEIESLSRKLLKFILIDNRIHFDYMALHFLAIFQVFLLVAW